MGLTDAKQAEADRAGLLTRLALFEELPPATLALLARRATPVHLRSGSVLMREGGPGDALYAVVSGRLRVFVRQPDGSQAIVGEIGAGEVVGEMSLLSERPRTATVRAVRDSHLLELARTDFESLLEHDPTAMLAIARLIVSRLERSIHGSSAGGSMKSVAVVAAGASGHLGGFAQQLATALAGSATVVTAEDVGRHLGPDHVGAAPGTPADLETVAWLQSVEDAHDTVLYLAEPELNAWTERCLRQSDRVLLAGHAGVDPHINAVEQALLAMGAAEIRTQADLVIVHPPEAGAPRGYFEWQRGREGLTHHHVRAGSSEDLARLGRVLKGRAVNLVLSGGGARGLAHIGVLRALEEAGVPVDMVGGSSFGSLIGAVRAEGAGWSSIRERVVRFLVDRGSPLDLTAPAAALTGGRRIVAMLRHYFGERMIEDLWHRFFAVSSNLTTGELQVHTTGPTWRAVRASISIPGLFPPVNSGTGDVLVDGAVMNNLPVDVMQTLSGGGPILAVNLRGELPMKAADLPHHGVLSGWRVFGRRLNPWVEAPALPGIVDVLLRTTEMGSVLSSKRLEREADLVFHPPVDDFSLLDFSACDSLIEVGYRHATEVLEQAPSDSLAVP